MVTDLLNAGVECALEEDPRYGESGTIRGLYLEGTTIMVIVEWDEDSRLICHPINDLKMAWT
jgi:hypothetical protein